MPAMGKHRRIDQSVRDLIINWCVLNTKSYAQAARDLGISISTVKNIADVFLKSDRTSVLTRGGNRHGVLTEEHKVWLQEQLDQNAVIPMKEITDLLNDHFNLQPPVSRSTVSRAVSHNVGYTLKLLRKEPVAYNDPPRVLERQRWAQSVNLARGIPKRCIFLDEAGFNLYIKRTSGRAAPGHRAIVQVPTKRGRNMTLMVAVDDTGVLAHHFGPGGYNSQKFQQFLEDDLFPTLDHRRTIVLDSARFHKTDAVATCCRRYGHKLLFLCPYSPYLNAAEQVFSKVKGFVKKQTVADANGLIAHVSTTIDRISAEDTSEWIRDVHRNFLLAHAGQSLGTFYSNQDHFLDIEAAHHDELTRLAYMDRLQAEQPYDNDGEVFGSEMEEGMEDREEEGARGEEVEEEAGLVEEENRPSPPRTRSGLRRVNSRK